MNRIFIIVAIAFSVGLLLTKVSLLRGDQTEKNYGELQPVIKKLRDKGVDSSFIDKIMSSPQTEFNPKYTRYNVIRSGVTPDYSKHYNDLSVSRTVDFAEEYDNTLMAAKKVFGVPKSVLAAILWIETRHGNYTGNHRVVNVYLSTAMSNEKEYIQQNIDNLNEKFSGSQEEKLALEEKIYERSKRKADWAIDQLVALSKIDKLDYINVLDIEGSWAGAFGISQFIPTSYVSWAYDGDGDDRIDLFDVKDAIFSTANYLKINGWGPSDEEQREAVFHYNNSSAYVEAVLTLAEKVRQRIEPAGAAVPNIDSLLNKPLKRQSD